MFRPNQAAHNHSPASLRLQMREYRKVHILKQRGGNQSIDVALPPSEDVPQQPQLWELPTWPDGTRQGAVLGTASPVA
jgi:protein ImuA